MLWLYVCYQRFRFCGDLDCPDWVLAEISILSKLVITFCLHLYLYDMIA